MYRGDFVLILVQGPENSGKSRFAEDLSVKINRGGLIYIATMIPVGDGQAGTARILRHRAQRDGLGFTTIEKPLELSRLDIEPDCTVLLEDIANLTGNYMFRTDKNGSAGDAFADVKKLAEKCGNLVMVSLTGLSQSGEFNKATNEYIAGLALINELVFELADVVVSVKNGEATVEKGDIPRLSLNIS